MVPPALGLPDGDRERLRMQLVRHEGIRLKPYRDQGGTLTIGIGRNLDEVGISLIEARMMMDGDIDRALHWLSARHGDWFAVLDPPRQAAVVNMAFNLGPSKFARFRKFLAAMIVRDYATAAIEMLHSEWSQQVGNRATELAGIIRTGVWPPSG
jgi:lysozyme